MRKASFIIFIFTASLQTAFGDGPTDGQTLRQVSLVLDSSVTILVGPDEPAAVMSAAEDLAADMEKDFGTKQVEELVPGRLVSRDFSDS